MTTEKEAKLSACSPKAKLMSDICNMAHQSSIYSKSLFMMSFHMSVERLRLRCLQLFIYLDIQRNGQSIILMDPCSR